MAAQFFMLNDNCLLSLAKWFYTLFGMDAFSTYSTKFHTNANILVQKWYT